MGGPGCPNLADEGSHRGSKSVWQGRTEEPHFPRKSVWKSGFAGWLRMLRRACNNKPRVLEMHDQAPGCMVNAPREAAKIDTRPKIDTDRHGQVEIDMNRHDRHEKIDTGPEK